MTYPDPVIPTHSPLIKDAIWVGILAYCAAFWAIAIPLVWAILTLPTDRLILAAVLAFLIAMVVHAARGAA